MLNAIYRLVSPRRFEIEFSDINIKKNSLIVRPTHLSICNADQRYYQGKREAEILAQKLPMALIHEGIGEIVYDGLMEYKPGEKVVMIPNTPIEEHEIIAENYLRSSKFRGSGFDGFMQDNIEVQRDRIVRLPQNIDLNVAAFTEIVSVSMHAITRFESIANQNRHVVGVWGDGNLGYITSVLLKTLHPEIQLCVLGLNEDKLSDFTFADKTYSVNELPKDFSIDHAFECVGNIGSQNAINQIIDYISPEGTIAILGVTENPVAINTRMMLEKGLRMFGSSRSGRSDFIRTVELYNNNPEVVEYLKNIVGAKINVNNIEDMDRAFSADIQKAYGKTIMIWDK